MSIYIQSGELRHLVTIESSTYTQDAYGEPTTGAFAPVRKVHAKIEPLTGREAFEARQTVADVTHKVTMRYVPELTSKMQLKLGTRTLRIGQIINPEERSIVHELMCVERK